MYLSLVERKIKPLYDRFSKFCFFRVRIFLTLILIYYFLFVVFIWPSYATFKFKFLFIKLLFYKLKAEWDPATLNTIISHIINYRYAQLRVFSKLCRIFGFFSCCGVLKTSEET